MIRKSNFIKRSAALSFCLLTLITAGFATPYFSGYAGVGGTLKDSDDSAAFLLDGFFSGQFDISPSFIIRTSASLYTTSSIFSDFSFKNKECYFNLDEFSLTYRNYFGPVTQFLAAFAGDYDPIGSDLFLQRQFGIDSFTSKLTESISGISKATIFDNSGIGIAYYLKLPANTALGLYGYYNSAEALTTSTTTSTTTTEEDTPSLNADLRFAGAWSQVALDFVFGCNMPIERTYTNADGEEVNVVVLIQRADLHMGLTAFFGNTNSSSLLFQAGITQLIVDQETLADQSALSLDNVFLFIEPKFVTKNLIFSVALFNMPSDMLEHLYFISNPTGINLTVCSPWIVISGNRNQFGGMITVSSENSMDSLLQDASNLLSGLDLHIIPYGSTRFTSGTLNYSVQISALGITTVQEFFKAMVARISYKTQF
ncbi:MAG: hypothetical protein K6G52_04750 [Treponemataceae bacterium]|nr:hypothetical protein [Treponemataceae bacterium]